MIIWDKNATNKAAIYYECPDECEAVSIEVEDVIDCEQTIIPATLTFCGNIAQIVPDLEEAECAEYKGRILCNGEEIYKGSIIINCVECD